MGMKAQSSLAPKPFASGFKIVATLVLLFGCIPEVDVSLPTKIIPAVGHTATFASGWIGSSSQSRRCGRALGAGAHTALCRVP